MNVLVLTPDRVGSTLLQRLITVYMAAHDYDKPVINIHELTNGLEIYWNELYQRQILGKPMRGPNKVWGYYQSLEEIVGLLEQGDHYKTCRLALYHIQGRKDSIKDQVQFYNYINDNFFIISARRRNLFEHAISWGIFGHSKHLNVYDHNEKINIFYNIYKNGINLDTGEMVKYLNRYRDYLEWCDQFFHVNSYFNYEDDLKDIEHYISNLDIFPNGFKKNWRDIFDIDWKDWNQCHKLISDLGSVEPKLLPNLNDVDPKDAFPVAKLQTQLTLPDQQHLIDHGEKYVKAYQGIQELVTNGTMVTGIPIKLQTLGEKRKIIKNFDECVRVYNIWVEKNGLGQPYTDQELKAISHEENSFWYKQIPNNLLLD